MALWPLIPRMRISIHALREESDGGTVAAHTAHEDSNPRPPRGERQMQVAVALPGAVISIHALREESDRYNALYQPDDALFQSTPSARRATA